MKPALRIVKNAPPPLDITAALRADIMARDWAAVHVAAERRQPVSLPECVRRAWRG